MNEEAAKKLRAPFPPEVVGKLPRAGIQLDYVGHAAVTDRLLEVDPEWTWEPVAFAEDGAPLIRQDGKNATLWIRLTVCGTTRYGVGSVALSAFEQEKQLISDALRNAAMRFGVALDLWSKQDLDVGSAPAGVDPTTGEVLPLDDIDAMKPRELHDALAARGLDSTGSVPEMRERLKASGAGEPASAGGDDAASDVATLPGSVSDANVAASPAPVSDVPGDASIREDSIGGERAVTPPLDLEGHLRADNYDDLTVNDLIAECGEREIDMAGAKVKRDYIELLRSWDRTFTLPVDVDSELVK